MSSRLWDAAEALGAKPWRAALLVEPRPRVPAARAPGETIAEKEKARHREMLEREYAEARERGYREGLAAARVEAAKIAALANQLPESLAALEASLADPLVDLAAEIARQVLRADPRMRREALGDVVREALAQLADDAGRAQIIVHPADVAVLRAHLGEEVARGEFTLTEDLRMEPGGCRIVTAAGEVDATLATRWRQVMATLGRDDRWTATDE